MVDKVILLSEMSNHGLLTILETQLTTWFRNDLNHAINVDRRTVAALIEEMRSRIKD